MNILVTGANGLLGSSLVNILKESKENKIYALVKNSTKTLNFEKKDNVEIIYADLSNLNISILPEKIDAVYYLAQSNQFRNFPDGSIDMLQINVFAPLQMINWAIKTNVKMFFYVSSGGVYKKPTQPVKEFFDIGTNEKNGFYLDSKLSAEIMLKNFANYFDLFAIFRPFFIYGENQNSTMLIPRLINNIKQKKEILLNGSEGIKINPIYVSDASKAFANALWLKKGEYIFNIAGNEVVSLKEICTIIGQKLSIEPVYKVIDKKATDLVADTTLMHEKLFVPKVTLKNGISKLLKDDL